MKMACPNCGGNIIYIFGSDHVFCEYCNEKVEVEKVNISEFTKYVEKVNDEIEENKHESFITRMLETNETMPLPMLDQDVYECPRCKSEFVHNQLVRGKSCPFCFREEKDKIKTDKKRYNVAKIIPFSMSKDNICNIVSNCIESYEFSPSNVFAMYIPYLVSYDDIKANGEVTVDKKKKHVSINEKHVTFTYAGCSVERSLAERAVDFDFSKFREFNYSYFEHGVVLDNYDESIKRDEKIINDKIIESLEHEIFIKEKMKLVSKGKMDLKIENIKEEIWLLPIYIYKDTYNGINNTMLINGQNGRLIGKALDHKIGSKRLQTLLICLISMILIGVYSYARTGQYGIPLIVFQSLIILITAIKYFMTSTVVKDIDSKGHEFYGITYDKNIDISN